MRRVLLLIAAAGGLVGCGQTTTTFVKSDTTLGRVVVYRNGVAYFERYAEVQGDSLKLNVPQDKVDDFLKSLTVVDANTGEPAPISYPSLGQTGGTIDMKIGTAGAKKPGPKKLRLSYVTEAPSWKPSYRVVVEKNGKVSLQAWAIVDNTSGEDWKDVRLGVGASSAMSFRFDLKGLRLVERETLQENDLFAQAPPMGAASYGGAASRVVATFDDDTLANAEQAPGQPQRHAMISKERTGGARGAPAPTTAPPGNEAQAQVDRAASSLRGIGGKHQIVVEGFASSADADKGAASQTRANRLRDQLVKQGVDASRIVAVGRGEQAGQVAGARVAVANTPAAGDTKTKPDGAKDAREANAPTTPVKVQNEPIGASHFESGLAMTVPKGTSAMVSILRSETDGEVVYLFDPESTRGNAQYPFKTLRFRNPTDSALESGPVSVFGDGKFVGEGLAEPIPGRSVAFVPFALDRQVLVERKNVERDEIARLLTVNRGVFNTEIKHTKKSSFTLFNRAGERATVYVKHSVTPGYKLTKFPDTRSPVPGAGDASDHLSGANLFRVDLEPNGKAEIEIEEATPVNRTTDIKTAEGIGLIRAYLSGVSGDNPLKAKFEQLIGLNGEMVKAEQQIATTHEQMAEYRQRMDELHAQLVTLKAVKTAGPLMTHLEKKLQEFSEKLSKATVDVVVLQEKLMVARVQFQTGVADLTLEKPGKTPTATASN